VSPWEFDVPSLHAISIYNIAIVDESLRCARESLFIYNYELEGISIREIQRANALPTSTPLLFSTCIVPGFIDIRSDYGLARLD
jgi:hypothetical protein